MFRGYLLIIVIISSFLFPLEAQEQSASSIKSLVETYKEDVRGPYLRIKWFCEDGTEREPKDPCPDDIGGGIQHANFKQSAINLRKTNHLYFGEILAATKITDVLDASNNYSRLKQYQLNKYLASVDNGWVLRKAQYYRGAVQSEDEQAWGKEFFETILRDDKLLNKNYYLIRQALKDIPHNEDSNVAQLMRSQSKIISDEVPSFMDIRIKIHGQPEVTDIKLVENYIKDKESKLSSEQKGTLEELIATMQTYYAPMDFKEIAQKVGDITETNDATKQIKAFVNTYEDGIDSKQLVAQLIDLLSVIRTDITSLKRGSNRLKLMDLSNAFENTLLVESQKWKTETIGELLEKINILSCAAMGTGLLEVWEYNAIEITLNDLLTKKELTLNDLNELVIITRSVVEWSTSMVKANYQDIVDTYTEFEPLAYGFIDDRVRSSIALSLGEAVSSLGAFVAAESNINNQVMKIDNQSTVRGLNPGYAFGELVVVDGNPDGVEVNTSKIYIFQKPPSDLKPVAGIMTVSEGNLVSHVQLLARNLGIPNAALSNDNLKELKSYDGKKVFYAVSNKGNVILKTEDDMSSEEKALFSTTERSKNVIAVPVDQIRLDVKKVVDMRDVDAADSGKLCGPKAANLGELKKMFPEKVVEGIIIPFGIFRDHMDKDMPNENKSYWAFLNDTFAKADQMRAEKKSESEVEAYLLQSLDNLHKAMLNISLDDSFVNDLKSSFNTIFGTSMGKIPVFLRSDTNMEDLKEFTGAGLNLTLFNILEEQKILDGIKRVWASAYTERSFKWRQKYLSNPENVFPSILIIPSVDVEYSGVMITKGINSGTDDDLTVAFSPGAGGAVDGQSAETRLITSNANMLLTPGRQATYIRLPDSGGTKSYTATFDAPILNEKNINDIRDLAKDIRKEMDKNNEDNHAYDVEFGFKNDKLWLFQIRPFVENKQAKSSEYLASITPKVDAQKSIKLNEKL